MGKISTLILVALYLLAAPLFSSHPGDDVTQRHDRTAAVSSGAGKAGFWNLAARQPRSESVASNLR